MAIAPLSFEEWGIDEIPTTPVRDRSHLRVVPDLGPTPGEGALRAVATPLQRLEARRVLRRRRQVLVGGALLLASLVACALPASVFGGRTSPAVQLVGNAAPGAALGIYTVQPGDTVASIAKAHASGEGVAELASAIEAAIGSSTVVPGETINLNP